MTTEDYAELNRFAEKYGLDYHGKELNKSRYSGYYCFSTFCDVDVDYVYDKGFKPIQRSVVMFIWIDQNKEFPDRLSPKRVYMEFSTHPADRVQVNLNWLETITYSTESVKSEVRKKVKTFIESWNTIRKEKQNGTR